jgi:hypothetical protein
MAEIENLKAVIGLRVAAGWISGDRRLHEVHRRHYWALCRRAARC